MGGETHLWSTEYRNLSRQDLEDLLRDADAFARRCWNDLRVNLPKDEFEDCRQEAIAKLLASETPCEPPGLETVRRLLLTAIRNQVYDINRRRRLPKRYRSGHWAASTHGKEPPPSPFRNAPISDESSLVDSEEAIKREQREEDEDYEAQFARLRDLITCASPKARSLIAERLDELLRAGKIDPNIFKTKQGEPVEIDIAKASRAAKFGDRTKKMRVLVGEKFAEIRKILGVNSLAEFLELETPGERALTAARKPNT